MNTTKQTDSAKSATVEKKEWGRLYAIEKLQERVMILEAVSDHILDLVGAVAYLESVAGSIKKGDLIDPCGETAYHLQKLRDLREEDKTDIEDLAEQD